MINVDIKKFESLAARWELVNHVYNEVYKHVYWTTKDMLCCRPCYSMFFKVDYLNSQKPIDTCSEKSNPSSKDLSPLQPTPSRSSSCKRCTYETDRYEEGKKQ